MYQFNRVSIHFIGLVLLISIFSSCKADKSKTSIPKPKNPITSKITKKAKTKNILFYGNSLTAGYGLQEKESFPSLIQGIIDSLSLPYTVINAGLSGETTSGGKERINWILKQPIDVFVLELGANDMLRGLDIASTKANLDTILFRVRTKYPGVKLLLAEMKASPNMGADYTKAFNQIYFDLAGRYKINMIPFFLENVIIDPKLLLPDGKHPNAKGQKIVASHIWEFIQPVL